VVVVVVLMMLLFIYECFISAVRLCVWLYIYSSWLHSESSVCTVIICRAVISALSLADDIAAINH